MKKHDQSTAITSKPRIPGIVRRERLFKQIDDGCTKQMTWISGPAGAGKTTLVSSYVDNRNVPCVWFQAEEGDNDAASFFYHLGHAVRKATPRYKKPLPFLTPEYLAGFPVFSKHYFESVYARFKVPAVIVLDNYQAIATDSPVHTAILQAATLASNGIRLIIVSRTEPLPSFVRLVMNNQLQSLTAVDLRFTEGEARQYFSLRTRRSLSSEAQAEIHARSQGWAAGLALFTEIADRTGYAHCPAN